jgi:hypothetical protein
MGSARGMDVVKGATLKRMSVGRDTDLMHVMCIIVVSVRRNDR